jgi:prepilin-type N-terminal cleavage/methylation domain-containing protein
MPVARRGGFTLIELLTALVLTGLIGLVLIRAITSLQRVARAGQEGAALQLAFDGGLGFLAADLAHAGRGSAGEDLVRIAPDSLSYRGIRGVGIACQVDPTGVVVPATRLQGVRAPQPGRDSLLLYAGIDSLQVARGGWLALPLLGVVSASCGGGPAIRLLTAIDTITTPLASLPVLPPVRIFEVMQARFYPSLGTWWLGARSESAGETIQPLAGPFESAGSPFGYRDSLQQPTLSPGAVEEIQVQLVGRWMGWPGGASRMDSANHLLSERNLSP